ncbi:hypothetical protein CEXT_98421 [Caerostris extrusa]|uniref:Uncharacterized protein n=1 Tax=Caerostris extrusa TaxID=172846 RepID=A0AAV4S153_CAEEX|nr:hypothetical protein CEXT_98421 [Caerostris extrusa]
MKPFERNRKEGCDTELKEDGDSGNEGSDYLIERWHTVKSSSGGSQSPRSGVVIGGKLPDGVTVSGEWAIRPSREESEAVFPLEGGLSHVLTIASQLCRQRLPAPSPVKCTRPIFVAFFAYTTPRVCDFYVSFYCFFLLHTLDFCGGRDRHVRLDSRPPVHVDGSRILRSPSPGVVIAADNGAFIRSHCQKTQRTSTAKPISLLASSMELIMENHHTNGTNGEQDPSLIQYESSLYKFKGNFFVYLCSSTSVFTVVLCSCVMLSVKYLGLSYNLHRPSKSADISWALFVYLCYGSCLQVSDEICLLFRCGEKMYFI